MPDHSDDNGREKPCAADHYYRFYVLIHVSKRLIIKSADGCIMPVRSRTMNASVDHPVFRVIVSPVVLDLVLVAFGCAAEWAGIVLDRPKSAPA